jgi:hypothetical protein
MLGVSIGFEQNMDSGSQAFCTRTGTPLGICGNHSMARGGQLRQPTQYLKIKSWESEFHNNIWLTSRS